MADTSQNIGKGGLGNEENTNEIINAKEFMYLIQNQVQLSHQISFVYFKLLKNTNVPMKTFYKSFIFASVLYPGA